MTWDWTRCTFVWSDVPGAHAHVCKGFVGTGEHMHVCECGSTLTEREKYVGGRE